MAFDRNDPADLQSLQTEMNTDPEGLGYVPDNTDAGVNLINAPGAGTVEKPKISSADVRAATTFEAYDGLLADRQEWLRWMTGSNGFEEENFVVTDDAKQMLAGIPTATGSIWATGERTEMNAAMAALINVPGSRAEVKYGFGTGISRDDWIAARGYQA